MGDSADNLLRSGAISPKQASKHGLKALKGTKVNRPDEEAFDGKQGLADQGRGKQKGHKVATRHHVDKPNQKPAFPSAGGKAAFSKGAGVPDPKGAVNSGEINKGSKGGTDESPDEIDQGSNQKPSFPREARGRDVNNKRAKAKIPAQGGFYGGGGRNTQ